jgi:hypothetical protein
MALPRYTGHKTVAAAKILDVKPCKDDFGWTLDLGPNGTHNVSDEWLTKRVSSDETVSAIGGYLVIYADGYESWSPAEAFENGYKPEGSVLIQPAITGYRQLSPRDADMMNIIKALGKAIEEQIANVANGVTQQRANAKGDGAETVRLDTAQPERWISIARTHFQEGLMALTRAVAQPGSF